jgi:hypothetical protein
VTAALAAQTHRRFIKTHAPLDGLPRHAEATYLVVGRDPRDVAISWEHNAANMDFARVLELRAAAVGNADLAELPAWRVPSADPVERFRRFVADESSGVPPTLTSVLHHLDTGWQHRREPNVALFHYADLTADLAGELLRLASVLGIPCSPARARELAPEASLTRMRERAADVAPGAPQERWKDTRAFFRSGGAGEWRARLSAADLAAYEARVAQLVGPELAAWAHGGRLASGADPERCPDRARGRARGTASARPAGDRWRGIMESVQGTGCNTPLAVATDVGAFCNGFGVLERLPTATLLLNALKPDAGQARNRK